MDDWRIANPAGISVNNISVTRIRGSGWNDKIYDCDNGLLGCFAGYPVDGIRIDVQCEIVEYSGCDGAANRDPGTGIDGIV
ncbi:MAG: hypothetical protein GWO26_30035 [Phycisphaerae bacterium]|nr:hypothetical protein [Phycisphaerae bacterium]